MKTGRSLQDWAKEIERRANAKRDFMVDTRSMEIGFREGEQIEQEKHTEDDGPIEMEHRHGE